MSGATYSLSLVIRAFMAVVCIQVLAATVARADGPDILPPGYIPDQPVLPPATLYVVIGGNGTCTLPSASRVFPNLQSNDLFKAFESSLVVPGYLMPRDNVLFACYEWLSPMMRFYDSRFQPVMTAIHENQLDELVLSRTGGMARVVIIGHSHGGWRAIKLAASPYLAANLQVPMTLVSVDPISRVTCLKMRDIGCREAPRDLSFEELNYLHGRVRWLNAYQNNGLILSSGAIPAAHSNIPVVSNHIAIQMNATIWQAALGWIFTP